MRNSGRIDYYEMTRYVAQNVITHRVFFHSIFSTAHHRSQSILDALIGMNMSIWENVMDSIYSPKMVDRITSLVVAELCST